MIRIDTEEIKQFESDLKTFASRAYPFATKETINTTALSAREGWVSNVRNQMVLRNKFTEKSLQVEKARTLNVRNQTAVVGSTADYMEDQEFGTTINKAGKVGVSIPTTVASGEGEGAQPRRRAVPKSRRLGNISLRNNSVKGKTKKQMNFLKIKQTAKSGRKFVFLDLRKHPGIYRVTGGVRRPQIKLIHDMSKESVVVPRNPTLAPAVEDAKRVMPFIYREALIFQLKRQRLFRD